MLPVNKVLGGQFQLVWKLPTVSVVSDILHNPCYAGANVYGHRPAEVVVKEGRAAAPDDRQHQRVRSASGCRSRDGDP